MPLVACFVLHFGPTWGTQELPLHISSGRVALFLNLLAQRDLHKQARDFRLFACLAQLICVMTIPADLQMPVTLGPLVCLPPLLWDQQPSTTASATWPTLAAALTWLRQGLKFQAHLLSATMAHGKPTQF